MSHPPPDCTASEDVVPTACRTSRYEATQAYDLLFVEFDDQGLLYPDASSESGTLWPSQIEDMIALLRRLSAAHSDEISLFLFVHGWKHNASSDDGDVNAFREVLQSAAFVEGASQRPHRVIGVYVSWRGLSATFEPFLELSFWERKATALYVAQGSARGLLMRLKDFQRGINCPSPEACIAGEPPSKQRPKVRFVMIGHSFGGLILFNALAETLVGGITYREDSGDASAPVVRFGDMVVLLNPAFEASRYTPLHRIVTSPRRQFTRYQPPILVSVTSTADWATRYAFRAGRFVNTLFENTASDEEALAIKNTIGHVDLYVTHELTKTAADPPECRGWRDVMTVAATDRPAQMRANLAAEATNNAAFFGPDAQPSLKDGYSRLFCGGTRLQHVKYSPNSPIWNVRTNSEIMNGHSDIRGTELTNFLRQLYKDSYSYPSQ
jgi:hypothetical protein